MSACPLWHARCNGVLFQLSLESTSALREQGIAKNGARFGGPHSLLAFVTGPLDTIAIIRQFACVCQVHEEYHAVSLLPLGV